MIELYGWLSLQGSDSTELESDYFSDVVKKAQGILSSLKWNDISLEVQNGTPYVLVALHSNHRTQETEEILQLFKTLENALPQSYGTLFLLEHDEAEEIEHSQMFVYAAGTVVSKPTPFKTDKKPDRETNFLL